MSDNNTDDEDNNEFISMFNDADGKIVSDFNRLDQDTTSKTKAKTKTNANTKSKVSFSLSQKANIQPIKFLIKKTIIYVMLLLFVVVINTNLIYILKYAPKVVLDEWFSVKGSVKGQNPDTPECGAGKPKGSVLKDYAYWFFSAFNQTNIAFNCDIQNLISNPFVEAIPEVILLFFGFFVLLFLPISNVYYFFSLVWEHFTQIANVSESSTVFFIWFTSFCVVFADGLYSIYQNLLLFIKLTSYALLTGKWSGTGWMDAVNSVKYIIAYAIGYLFLKALWETPFNQHYAYGLKVVPTILYTLIILLHLSFLLFNYMNL